MNNVQPIIAGPGHNNPPSDIEILQENLRTKYDGEIEQARWLCSDANAQPREITDEETASKFTDAVMAILSCDKALNSHRESEKEPFNKGGRAVDGFFNPWLERLTQAKSQLNASLTVWQRVKAEEERQRRLAQEAELRAAAERKAQEAAAIEAAGVKDTAGQHLEQAVALEQQAGKSALAAIARPSDLTKSRGATGSVASLRATWMGELTSRAELDLETLRAHLPEDALVKAIGSFVRAGGRTLRGAHIFEKTETVVR